MVLAELEEEVKEKALEICYDRYLCEKANIDYNHLEYADVVNYVLKEMLKQNRK